MSGSRQEGKLSPKALGELFKRLEGNRSAAFLLVSDGVAEKCLYFSVGAIRLTSMGKRRGVRLEDALARHPKVDPGVMDSARARQAETGEPLEEILAGTYGLNEVVRECSTAIVRDEVLDLLLWDGAVFEYADANPPPKIFDPRLEAVKLSFGVPKLLKEATDTIPKTQRLLARLAGRGKLQRGPSWAYGVPADGEKEACEAVAAAMPQGGASFDETLVGARQAGIDALRAAEAIEKMLDAKTLDLPPKQKGGPAPLSQEEIVEQARRDVGEIEGALDLIINELVARQRLAKGYLALGDQPKAVYNLKRVGDELLHRNKGDEAVEAYREIVKIVPHDFGVREKIAFLYEKMKRVPEAIGEGLDLAKLYKQFGLFNRAKNIFRRVINLDPENVEHRKDLIELLVKLRETPDAIAEYENLAELFARHNQENELYATYKNILALDPNHAGARDRTRAIVRAKPGFWAPYVAVAAGFVILAAASYYVIGEKRALDAYVEARARAFSYVDRAPPQWADAQNAVDGFLRVYDTSRVAARAKELKTQLGELEKSRRERKAAADFALGREYENKGLLIPKARDLYARITTDAPGTKWDQEAASRIKEIDRLNTEEAEKAFSDVHKATEDKKPADAFAKALFLLRKYPWSDAAQRLRLRFEVTSIPSRAQVIVNGERKGMTPCTVELATPPIGDDRQLLPLDVAVSKEGFSEAHKLLDLKQEVPYPLVVELKRELRWRAETLGPVEAAPLVTDDGVFVAGRDERVWAFDPKEVDDDRRPKVLWSFPLGLFAEATGRPLRAGPCIVVGDRTGQVTAIDAATGKLAWHAATRGAAVPISAPSADTVLVADDEAVVALGVTGAQAGKERWRFSVPGGLAVAPSADTDGSAIVVAGDGSIYVVDATSGKPKAKPIATRSRPSAPVGVAGLGFVVASEDGEVRFLARDGRQSWTAKLPGIAVAAPLVPGDGACYVGAGSELVALDMSDGSVRWKADYGSEIRATPAYRASGSRLYVATDDGALHALAADNHGSLLWSYRTQGEIVAPPVAQAASATVFVASKDFGLYAIRD